MQERRKEKLEHKEHDPFQLINAAIQKRKSIGETRRPVNKARQPLSAATADEVGVISWHCNSEARL